MKNFRNILLYCFFIYSVYCQQTESSRPETHEIVTERYLNGVKKLVHRYQGTGINEILIGKYGFYENGIKNFIELYNNNQLNGTSLYWYENGQKESEGTYKDGKEDGLFTKWFKSGEKKSEGTYKDGKKDGLWTYWYENGQKMEEETYKDGEEISSKCWNTDGSVK